MGLNLKSGTLLLQFWTPTTQQHFWDATLAHNPEIIRVCLQSFHGFSSSQHRDVSTTTAQKVAYFGLNSCKNIPRLSSTYSNAKPRWEKLPSICCKHISNNAIRLKKVSVWVLLKQYHSFPGIPESWRIQSISVGLDATAHKLLLRLL